MTSASGPRGPKADPKTSSSPAEFPVPAIGDHCLVSLASVCQPSESGGEDGGDGLDLGELRDGGED